MDSLDRDLQEALHAELSSVRAPDDLKTRTLAAMKAARDEGNATTFVKEETKPAAGEVISLPRSRRRHRLTGRFVAALVACCCLLFVGGGGTYVYATPTAYVAVETASAEGTQIELSLNRFDRVVGATAATQQAQAILDTCDINHKTYEEAVTLLLAQAASTGIISSEDVVAITVACDEAGQCSKLTAESDECIADTGCKGSASQTSMAERGQARNCEGARSGRGSGQDVGNGNGNGKGKNG